MDLNAESEIIKNPETPAATPLHRPGTFHVAASSADLLLVDFETVTVGHIELATNKISFCFCFCFLEAARLPLGKVVNYYSPIQGNPPH